MVKFLTFLNKIEKKFWILPYAIIVQEVNSKIMKDM